MITKTQLAAALAHVQKYNAVRVTCLEYFCGFAAGITHNALATHHNGRATLGIKNPSNGEILPITANAAAFFELADPVPDVHGPEVEAEELRRLGAYLLRERPVFKPNALVSWIPGMFNRPYPLPAADAVMLVIEQVEPIPARHHAEPCDANGVEMVDLRVLVMANSGRDDESCAVEVMVDSRRIQHWCEQ